MLITTSCNLPEDPSRIARPDWEPEIAFPLVNSEIRLSSLLPDQDSLSFLRIDSEGLLSIVYETDLYEIPSPDVVSLPNVRFPMPGSSFSGPFPLQQLQRLTLKSGSLLYEFEGSHVGETRVRLRVLNAIDPTGQYFETTVSFLSPGRVSDALDLAGYTFELTDGTVDLQYEALTTLDNQAHTLSQADITLSGLDYSYLEGNIGQYTFDLGSDSLAVELSETFNALDLQLTDPRIRFILHNSYGVPVELKADRLSVIQSGGNQVSISSQALTDGLLLNHPALQEVGASKTTVIELNKDNSGIATALNPLPQGIVYSLSGTAHPSGDPAEMGFVTDSSQFSIGIGLELPLDGQLGPFTLEDTLEVEISVADLVESAGMILITDNGFPIDLSLQAYFLDEQGLVLDSLFNGNTPLLAGAPVDAQGAVTSSVSQRKEIDLTSMRIDAILNSKAIAFRATISTTDQGSVPVRIYEDYTLGLKMGLRAKVSPL